MGFYPTENVMGIYSIALFGHSEIENLYMLENKLTAFLQRILCEKGYLSILIGRNGEFDEYAASIIKQMKKSVGQDRMFLTLVLPYCVKDIPFYATYYDDIIIPEMLHHAHYKRALTLRNQWMIEQANLVACYIEHADGGAYRAYQYAQKQSKQTVNLYDMDTDA